MKDEIQLTRNKAIKKPNLTTQDEKKAHVDGGIVVSDRVELLDQQSIDLTDFKSFHGTSEYYKNIFSAQGRDGGFAGLLEKKTSTKIVPIDHNKNN